MVITVQNLRKDFILRRRVSNRWLFGRYEQIVQPAVNGISFDIAAGERVAFIGPNGAGKSTTLKMLSGILYPTSGRATVAGLVPWEQRRALAQKIGLVFGQRSQLWYQLPVRHSFDLLARIYGIGDDEYARQHDHLADVFALHDLLDRPVKTLSLGQRMRCEIAASLIHRPQILFLDEPTIGLDVTTKAELRRHLRALGEEQGTTLILTSHDTADVEEVCDRVILINHGDKLIDAPLAQMRQTYLRQKLLTFTTAEEMPHFSLSGTGQVVYGAHRLSITLDPTLVSVAATISDVLQQLQVHDVSVSDAPLEDIIKHIYATDGRRDANV